MVEQRSILKVSDSNRQKISMGAFRSTGIIQRANRYRSCKAMRQFSLLRMVKGMYSIRAKRSLGVLGSFSRNYSRRVCCSFTIAVISAGISGSLVKVSVSCVMLVCSRKIIYRYVMIGIGQNEDYYGLFLIEKQRGCVFTQPL